MVHIPSFFSSSPHSQAALPTVFFPCSLPLSAVSWTAKPVCGVQTASVSINPPGDGRGGVWGWWSGREDEGKTCEEEKGWLVGNAFVHTNCQPCSLTYLHSEWTNDSRCCIHLLSVFTHAEHTNETWLISNHVGYWCGTKLPKPPTSQTLMLRLSSAEIFCKLIECSSRYNFVRKHCLDWMLQHSNRHSHTHTLIHFLCMRFFFFSTLHRHDA